MTPRSLLRAALGALCLFTGAVQAASPSLQGIMPRGLQRGTTTEVTLSGERLADAMEVFLNRPGLSVGPLTAAEDGKSLRTQVTVAPDCPLGEHYLRLRARSGLSEVRTLWVGTLPSLAEAESNNDFEAPQKIPLGVTVEGVAENEDVDYFAVDLKKGQKLSLEVEGLRLSGSFWDPYVAVLNSQRFELVTADDTALLRQDCHAQLVAPEDGTYIIQIRDTSYVGNGGCRYRLHVGTFPRPTAVHPAGGQAGSEVEVTFLGDAGGEIRQKVTLPPAPQEEFGVHAAADGQLAPSPNWMRVSPFPNALETEPNDARESATPATGDLPLAFNGIIGQAGDVDWWKFSAKKDQKFTFVAHAKSLRSPLDPVLHIHNKDGGEIGGNDDQGGHDSRLDFTAPYDGEFYLRVRDHLGKGGADYVYRVEATQPAPALTLSIPQFARNDYQSRQMVPVPRGNRMAIVVNAARSNFGGDLQFEAPDLPAGVQLLADVMPQSSGGGSPVVFQAAEGAELSGRLVDFAARPIDEALRGVRGAFQQKLDLMMGEPNNTTYYASTIEKLAVAVVEEVPFRIDIEPPKVPLVHNGTMNLRVVATRREGFKAPITVRMLWFPPNVGGQPTIDIPEGQTEAVYTLNANANAEPRTWKIAVVGESDAGQGQVLASSDLVPLTIAPPYLGMKIEMAAIEQGKAGHVLCKLEWNKPFEGRAKVTLNGLPAKAEAPVLEVGPQDTELQFPVTTTAETPAGQHKQLFCSVEIPEAGALIPHNVGHGGVLRIDPPPPAPKEPAPLAENKPAEPPPAEPAKQLSRLEKLRLEAQQAAGN